MNASGEQHEGPRSTPTLTPGSGAGRLVPASQERPLTRAAFVVVLLFLVNLFLVSPGFITDLSELNPYDEAKYIDSGRGLVQGQLRDFAWSPLSSFVYAPIYLAVRHSPDWFLLSAWLGRAVLFSLLWLTAYILSREFGGLFHPLVTCGLMLITPSLLALLVNPSDALFASMSALVLSRMIAFARSNHIRDLWLGSVFLGLAALSRNDGLFLTPLFAGSALWIAWRRGGLKPSLAAVFLPASGVILAYLLVFGLSSGSFGLGTAQRGYSAFEWSQSTISGGTTEEGIQEARRLYGTPEENHGSVLRAILRNPPAFLARVAANVRRVPDLLLSIYGKTLGPILVYLGLVGLYAALRRRAVPSTVLLLIWPAPALLYLGFYLRPGFVLLSHFVPLVLAAAGVTYLASDQRSRSERIVGSAPLVALVLFGILDAKLAFLVAGLVFLAALLLIWASEAVYQPKGPAVGLLVALCAGLYLHGPFPSIKLPTPSLAPEERAVHFLQDHLPPGTNVGVPVPLPALAASMTPIALTDVPQEVVDSEGFRSWLENQGIRALYVDPAFIRSHADLWALIRPGIGSYLDTAFVGDPGSIQVLLVQQNPG